MKAIMCNQYGNTHNLKFEDVDKPYPKEDEVLVKVVASSVNTQNVVLTSGNPFLVRLMGNGLFRPSIKIPGNDLSGIVESVGKNVKTFNTGDEVMGDLSLCGYGSYAEYVCVPENFLISKPKNFDIQQVGGVCEASLVALQALRDKGQIKNGQKVLIYGASGGIGTFAVQIAKLFDTEVTAVCSSKNRELVLSIGVDHVLDYTKNEYPPAGGKYDLVFAIPYAPMLSHLESVNAGGIYVSTGDPSMRRIYQDMLKGPRLFKKQGKKIAAGWVANPNKPDLEFIKNKIESGKIKPSH